MNNLRTSREYIEDVLKLNKFAVLATENNGQPHTSLIAITPFESSLQLIFATYRNTLKYRNLVNNNKVAVLIESRDSTMKGLSKSIVLTIIGHTEEIGITKNESASRAHLKRHPEMESFMISSDCVILRIIAQSYQVVNGIDNIQWISAIDLEDVYS
jgi:uncharacterized pyridoxamine 5'-phosphate oxidase family protein